MREIMKFLRLPAITIEKAANGDADALNTVVEFYERFILKSSLKPLYDEEGSLFMFVDEYKRRRLETKLIISIVTKFKLA